MSHVDRRSFLTSSLALAGTWVQTKPLRVAELPAMDDSLIGRTAHTRFAVNVEMWFQDRPFLERIRATAALGFPAIEFWDWRKKDIDAVGALTRELDLQVAQFTAWGFEPGLNDPRNHPAFVRAIEEACAVAQKLGAKHMCVVGGNDQPGMTQAQMHDHILAGLRLAAPIAAEHGVTLILEPMNVRVDHKGHCLYGSGPALRIVRAVASPYVKINWDLYHMQISEGDLCGHLREGFDQVGYLQIADTPGRFHPGTGEVNYRRVLQEAYELGYRGFVGLECTPKIDALSAAYAVAAADAW